MIIVNLDVMLAKRKMKVSDLADQVGITLANISILKNGKAKAVRFETIEKKGTDAFAEAFHEAFPEWEDWNVKGSWRLYEDDFRE
jgi:putative transcriptional regulator